MCLNIRSCTIWLIPAIVFESPFYGVGCATATDIIGKWTKYDENLILQNPGAFAGILFES